MITRRRLIQSSAAFAATGFAGRAQPGDSAAAEEFTRPGNRPNLIMIVLDDVGFGDLGCYGSEIPTACADSLAAGGVRYNNFHVTSLCAPTRACLLTGRNAHAAGVGNIAEWGRDHPGYRGWIDPSVRTLPERLRPAGYRSYAVGKWHLSTVEGRNAAGPFDQWPTGRGFDHWYGFHGAAVDHWYPELWRNHAAHYPDREPDYHLTSDLVDQSIRYLQDHLSAAPEHPYFLYLALGACHYPYHVPAEYMTKHRGRYEGGWDELRQRRFAAQRDLGVVPDSARLAPRNADVPAWSDVTAAERRFSSRTQEAYAAFLHHTDDQLQRLVDFLATTGELDDTLLLLLSDNGAGSWAPPAGRLDVHRVVYIEPESIDELIARIDDVGSDESHPSYAPGWAQASNTPFKLYKGDTYEGGIRTPLIAHWPNGALPSGGVLSQYHHGIDIVPTILELIGESSAGTDGESLAYTWATPDAPTRKTQQHYETGGDRALWQNGWKAVTQHRAGTPYEDDHWALYHSAQDFTEIDDIGARHPQRLKNLIQAWHDDAQRNQVLPMEDDLLGQEAGSAPEPRSEYVFWPGSARLDRRSAPDILGYDYEIAAEVDLAEPGANGVILASGDSMAGYELFMRLGYLEYVYIYTRERVYAQRSPEPLALGPQTIGIRSTKTADRSATVELFAGDTVLASLTVPKLWDPKSLNAGVRCGINQGAPISGAYLGVFPFDQTLRRVIVSLRV